MRARRGIVEILRAHCYWRWVPCSHACVGMSLVHRRASRYRRYHAHASVGAWHPSGLGVGAAMPPAQDMKHGRK